MPSFDYATIRVVPRVEHEEFLNAGIVLFSLELRFLEARVHLDETRLQALWPATDPALIRRHLAALCAISRGDSDGGPIAQLPPRERFHWLVSPRSTIIQTSPVHTGLTTDPHATLDALMLRLRRV